MKLISTDDTILELMQTENIDFIEGLQKLEKIYNHAKFKKLPLQLGFFVPCDEDGNVLENKSCNKSCSPSDFSEDGRCGENGCYNQSKQYQQAQERVIFDSFYVFDDTLYQNDEMFWVGQFGDTTIEDLTPFNLTITENAIKKYNL